MTGSPLPRSKNPITPRRWQSPGSPKGQRLLSVPSDDFTAVMSAEPVNLVANEKQNVPVTSPAAGTVGKRGSFVATLTVRGRSPNGN